MGRRSRLKRLRRLAGIRRCRGNCGALVPRGIDRCASCLTRNLIGLPDHSGRPGKKFRVIHGTIVNKEGTL